MMRILAISGGEWRQLMIKTGALIWRKLLLRTNVAGITGSFGKTLVGAGNDTRRVARVVCVSRHAGAHPHRPLILCRYLVHEHAAVR